MKAKDLVLHHRSEWQVVEQVGQVLPHVRISVLAQTLIVKSVHLRNLPTLVVASQNRDAVLEAHLKAHEQGHSLDRVVPTINVIAHEEVVCVRGTSSNLKQLHKVVKLAVNVSANGHWAPDRLHVQLTLENLFCLYRQQVNC